MQIKRPRLDDVSNAITSSIKEISATPQQARLKVHAPLTAAMTAAGLEIHDSGKLIIFSSIPNVFLLKIKSNELQMFFARVPKQLNWARQYDIMFSIVFLAHGCYNGLVVHSG